MILLEEESKSYLYHDLQLPNLHHHELYDYSQQFKRRTEHETIQEVLKMTSAMAYDYKVPFAEMLFGGTEKEILQRGTDWCTDMARVCCVIVQCCDIPCRMIHLADKNCAYHGHVVCEAYYENHYGVIDPIYGFQFYNEKPLSAYNLLYQHHDMKIGYEGYMDLYGMIAINEYHPLAQTNDYTITKPNAYYTKLMQTKHNNMWFMGEDASS